ncbi:hypothetical protein CNR22_03300 [Sphingobacteriaceae bacterium]|nr:hypothetical protein CNR22_03300 [Sphingobacteriaceae bacterium]
MNFLKNSLCLICLAVIFLSSCKNDIELNAPYKEYPSVYAVLNPFEKIQMIRVNKVFLGEGNANTMAKVADSINYKQDEITVSIKHSSNPHVILFRDSMVTTSEGAFNTNQRVYVSNERLDTTGFYTLTIKNTHTGNVFTATATVIPRINARETSGILAAPYYPLDPAVTSGRINFSAQNPTIAVGGTYFLPVQNAKIYQMTIRSHFYNDLNGVDRSYDYVDFDFNDIKTTRSLSGTSYMFTNFKSGDYFTQIAQSLSKKNLPAVQGRKMYLIEVFVWASSQEYVDYMEYIKPSFGINQNKPLYSNFKDNSALGLFTFRSTLTVLKELDPVFISSFSGNVNTCQYKFYNDKNVVLGCK